MTIEINSEGAELLDKLAESYGTSKVEILRKGLALVAVADRAKREGKRFGIAAPGQTLETEVVGV
jgi:predicted transcriptional regulator